MRRTPRTQRVWELLLMMIQMLYTDLASSDAETVKTVYVTGAQKRDLKSQDRTKSHGHRHRQYQRQYQRQSTNRATRR
jgi:hypothetical protein